MAHAERLTAVVTGAAGALGQVLVAQALAEGEEVIAIDRRAGRPAQDVNWVEADLAQAPPRADCVPIHALYAAAGGFAMGAAAHELASCDLEAMWRMNVLTFVHAVRWAVPRMAPGSAIVAVGARSAFAGAAGMGPYVMAKSALHRLVETMADELAPNIRVNAVCPTILDTPANREAMPGADRSRWVDLDDAARVMRWLAGPGARTVSGQLLPLSEGAVQPG